jgi:hypothetical protein
MLPRSPRATSVSAFPPWTLDPELETADLLVRGNYLPIRPFTRRHVPPRIFNVCFTRWNAPPTSAGFRHGHRILDRSLPIYSTPSRMHCHHQPRTPRATTGLFSTWTHNFFFVLCHTWLLPLKSSLYLLSYILLHLIFPFRLGSPDLSYTPLHRILAIYT